MSKYYTDEVHAQIVLALLKAHGIKRIITSPGSANMSITGSVQNDPFFEVYSSVDERSAAYMACGMAHETGEPVVISCTGATASRNYLPGMTEAYYRKLPVIAITSTVSTIEVGHLLPQCIDRSVIPRDVARYSVTLPSIKDKEDYWDCEIRVNKALLELARGGGGPVHINIATSYHMKTFGTQVLPDVRVMKRYFYYDELPVIPAESKVAVFIGAHNRFTDGDSKALEAFAKTHNAVIFCDHTSAYTGYGRLLSALPVMQYLYERPDFAELKPDLIIHIGEISGDYPTQGFMAASEAPVWRVSEDGELRDRFKNLQWAFEMREQDFFKRQAEGKSENAHGYLNAWKTYANEIVAGVPELPYSNTWIAGQLATKLPLNVNLHLGILNSLRNWNLYEIDDSISTASNVGGFGIDGCVSTLIGAALADPSRLHFGVIGDLAFFYDINSLGNRHRPKNLRILLVNNGGGCEFELSSHPGSQFGEQTSDFISAGGHFGSKSNALVRHVAEDLGFKYLCADSKESFDAVFREFLADGLDGPPIVFECFTDFDEESKALELMAAIDKREIPTPHPQSVAKRLINKGVDETVKIMLKTLPWRVKRKLKNALE
jgi:2-succinyl-5-enolpyruvyl-6-hydroxy-3-cyclohexene-1-carboxylate synthase